MTEPNPCFTGPYDAENNGSDAYGHPVNGYGRCQPMNDGYNADPQYPGCPTRLERLGDLENMAWDDLTSVAAYYEIPIPNGLQVIIKPVLINLILVAEGYPPV